MNTKKLTPVQEKVMNRFSKGEKLVKFETNRMSGDVYFWCRKDENTGLWEAYEKALYPQLRKLLYNMITKDMYVKSEDIDKEYNSYQLHFVGAIGF